MVKGSLIHIFFFTKNYLNYLINQLKKKGNKTYVDHNQLDAAGLLNPMFNLKKVLYL